MIDSHSRISSGNGFQMDGAVTENAWRAMPILILGMSGNGTEDDQDEELWGLIVWLGLSNTFSTNRLYCAFEKYVAV